MPKSIKWFTNDHLVFIKLIGHLTKMPSYLNTGKTNETENIKRKTEERRLTLRRGRRPTLLAGPAHPRRLVVYLPAAPSCSVEAEHGHGATSTPRGFQPLWTSSPRLGGRLEAPFHFPLLWLIFLLSPS